MPHSARCRRGLRWRRWSEPRIGPTCLPLAQVHQLDVLPYIYGSEQVAEKPQAANGMRWLGVISVTVLAFAAYWSWGTHEMARINNEPNKLLYTPIDQRRKWKRRSVSGACQCEGTITPFKTV